MTDIQVQQKFLRAKVLENYPLRRPGLLGNYLIRLELEGTIICHPGQFFKFSVVEAEGENPKSINVNRQDVVLFDKDAVKKDFIYRQPLISRPYSIGYVETENNKTLLTFLYKIIGVGSQKVSEFQPGESFMVQGPLGGGVFWLPRNVKRALMVAGGCGLPPLLFLSERLFQQGIEDVQLFIGAASSEKLPLHAILQAQLAPRVVQALPKIFQLMGDKRMRFKVATDDGSEGYHGFVTDLLRRQVENHSPADTIVYTCGPWKMMALAAETAREYGIACQVCLEEMMGCGIGACQSCAVKIKSHNEKGWEYKLVCRDGPVFDANDVYWDK